MRKEASDRPPLFGTVYSGPANRSLTDNLHLRSVSRSSSQILAWSSMAICNTGLFQGSQKLSLVFHLMPGYINKFKKRVLLLETFVSCGATERTRLNQKNGCFDRNHLVCGTARPQGWETASLLGQLFFTSWKTDSQHIFVFWPWLSDCQNQENKVWQADGCSKETTTKYDKAVTHLVACGSDNAIAMMAQNQDAFPRLTTLNPKPAATATWLMSGTT